MRYCPKCKKIYEDEKDKCDCGIFLVKDVKLNSNDPVFLISAYGFEKDRIKSALSDYEIPFEEKFYKKQLSGEIVTGYNDVLVNIYVPFCKLTEAKDLIIGIGADNKPLDEKLEPSEENFKQGEKTEEMSSQKRLVWRIISLVLFLILIWGVVAGTDYIIALIKGFM